MIFSYWQYYVIIVFICRGLIPPDAEMLYMQEVERMEGYGEETYPAKVNRALIFVSVPLFPLCKKGSFLPKINKTPKPHHPFSPPEL